MIACYHINTITCENCAPKSAACPVCTPKCPHGYPVDGKSNTIPYPTPRNPHLIPSVWENWRIWTTTDDNYASTRIYNTNVTC